MQHLKITAFLILIATYAISIVLYNNLNNAEQANIKDYLNTTFDITIDPFGNHQDALKEKAGAMHQIKELYYAGAVYDKLQK